jgi:Domain of unknown function (DUF6457)
MNEWLAERADALAHASGVERDAFDLSDADVDRLLELAGFAAHSTDLRTNAPLLCYLVGVARGRGMPLDELDRTARSTS